VIFPTRQTIWLLVAGLPLALGPSLGFESLAVAWMLGVVTIACLVSVDALYAPRAAELHIALNAPESLFIGEPTEATLELTFNRPVPVPIKVLVDVDDLLRPIPEFDGACPPTGLKLTLPLSAIRRGQAVIESAWVRFPGPLRLAARRVRCPLEHRINVVPNVMPARRMALRCAQDRHFYAGLKIERYRGDGSEFESLREFAVGDELRSVHWRASARHRRVLSQQFQAERNHQVILAIDTGRLMSESINGVPKVDHAVTSALVMAYVSLKSGDRCGLFSFADRVGLWAAPRSGMETFRGLQQRAADLAYSRGETNYTLGLMSLSRLLSRRSLIVVLTDFVDSVSAELMIENLGRLSRKHVVVFVTLRDPQLDHWRRSTPESPLAINRAITAADFAGERLSVLRRLERLGLQTIDSPPKKITSELINHYLDIKRKEKI
jgi:uncharacterized protein (DUF58 family)